VSRLRLALAGVLAAVSLVVLFVAHDVRAWHDTLSAAAVDYDIAPKEPVSTTPSTILPAGVAGSILGVDRDRRWLDALQKFVVTYDFVSTADQLGPAAYQAIHATESALTPLTQDRDPARSSQAHALLAVLQYRSAFPGDSIDPGLIQDAIDNLQTAVRVDGGDELAKEDLEIVLRTLTASKSSTEQAQGVGNHVLKLRKGGYGGPPGRGY
jgi:hypothetical protein